MKNYCTTIILSMFCFFASLHATTGKELKFDEAINNLALKSPASKIQLLGYKRNVLDYENYKKSFLPSLRFSLSPFSFNRSLKLLQNYADGTYSYAENYVNNSSVGLTISQLIGPTGGSLTVGSSLNYLREFSKNSYTYSSAPFSVSYTQKLRGGHKQYKLNKTLREVVRKLTDKQYISALSSIQQQTLSLYLNVVSTKLNIELSLENLRTTDTLLLLGREKLKTGHITPYDLNQLELNKVSMQYANNEAIRNNEKARQALADYLDIKMPADVEIPKLNLPDNIDYSAFYALV